MTDRPIREPVRLSAHADGAHVIVPLRGPDIDETIRLSAADAMALAKEINAAALIAAKRGS